MLCLEAFLDSMDDTQHKHQLVCCLHSFTRMQAVVALATVVRFIFLSEVMEQELAPTNGCLGIGSRLLQQLSADVLFSDRLALHELLQLAQVMGREEGQADTFTAIAAGSSGLLIIPLQALGNVIMYDVAHIGLVDTHAKGNGSHDDIDALHEEVILCLGSVCRLHAGMIGTCCDVVGTEHLRQLLHAATAQTIDDAALALVLEDETCDVLVNVLRLGADFVVEVGAVEGTAELRSVGNAQVLLDIRAHLVRCRSSQSNNWSPAYLVGQGADVPVFRTEVMSPLRDTMRLIYGIE